MKRLREFPYLFEIIALVGLVLYVAQSWVYAHSLDSIGDEGAYLYKGYMYARGDYRPFQEYAFWTNKAPLAFLIPGYIQLWFGPGLAVARYFSIVLGVLMLLGIWITARRLGGRLWAAIAVWIVALSSTQIILYSEAVSQVLISCMIAWMLVFTLGDDRPIWQIILGSAMSVLVVMTRQNIAVLPAFLVLYIFWQHGKKAGLWSLATCAVLFIAFHAYYWPNILQLWAPWLPASLTPFLNSFRPPVDAEQTYAVFSPNNLSRLQSFATGMQDNFFIFFGSASVLALFPKRSEWKQDSRFKMAVFLGITFLILFIMHTLASIFIPYCVYCFSGYQMFYSTLGLFFVLVVVLNGVDDSPLRRVLLLIVVLFFAAALGLYYHPVWGTWLLDHVYLPRINRLFSGDGSVFVPLRDVFTYTLDIKPAIQKRLAPVIIALFLGGVLWVIVWAVHRFLLQRTRMRAITFVNSILLGCLVPGMLLPFGTRVMDLGQGKCATNYLSYYEKAGRILDNIIPPGSLVYLRASGRQRALMLYLNDIKIFPPQIHAGAGRVTGDTDKLLQFGLYNDEIDRGWRSSADILLVGENYTSSELFQFLQQNRYEQIQYDMGELSQCEDALYVFRRTQ